MLIGGSDTVSSKRALLYTIDILIVYQTVSSLGSFFLGVVLNPEVQKRAQMAIDQVCHDRLPTFSDMQALPYIDAIVKESLRWNPVLPIGMLCVQIFDLMQMFSIDVAHGSTADDIYRGYFIPKGSLILANSWCVDATMHPMRGYDTKLFSRAILHDEVVYPDPLRFNPDRFMKGDKLDSNVRDPEAAFGFGRRICPGKFMAYEAMWIAIACTLAVFYISKAKDEHGNTITPKEEYNIGFAWYVSYDLSHEY